MNAYSPSAPALYAAARAPDPSVAQGRSTVLEKTRAVALLTLVSALWNAPMSMRAGTSGANLVLECFVNALVLGAFLVLFMTLVERATVPGRLRTLAFAGAAVLAAVLGGIVEGVTFRSTGVWHGRNPFLVDLWANLGGMMVMAVCFVLIYDYRFRLRHRLRSINDMRLRRARLVRETVESQQQAMQARVDPKFLFDTMACVERTYARDPARGDLLLDDLIAYLRAMLPDLGSTTSSLARELALGRAFVDISTMVLAREVVLEVDAPVTQQEIGFPPMCLVPMLRFLLADAEGDDRLALTLRVRVLDSKVLVEARAARRSSAASTHEAEALEAMRRRMRDLYGERTRLTVTHDAVVGRGVLLEIPHEHPDGPDRRG